LKAFYFYAYWMFVGRS